MTVFLFLLPLTVPAAAIATPQNDLSLLLATSALLDGRARVLLLAGLCAGLAFHVKQNLGTALFVALLLLASLQRWMQRQPGVWRVTLATALGVSLGVGLPLLYFLHYMTLEHF